MTCENIVLQLKSDIEMGSVKRKISDKSYICDILKVLHDSSIVCRQKQEFLVLLEEQTSFCRGIDIEEVLRSLKECLESNKDVLFSCQLLSTMTSLMIQFEILATDICSSIVKILTKAVTSGVDSSESCYYKSCCCQCLCQIEEWKPGTLWSDREYIFKSFRQEKMYIHQDYATLVTKIVVNGVCGFHQTEENGENGFLRQQSTVEPQEFRQMVSIIMENPELYTPSGLWHVVTSVKEIVQNNHNISPTIFKPLMLHHMSTMDPVILHLIIFIMVEFENEILTEKEESQIIGSLIRGLDHPSLVPAQRLFFAHWLKQILLDSEKDYGIKKYQLNFYPRVFDPIDCQLSKLLLLNSCIPRLSELPSDMNGALLLASVGYLHKLVWHTGNHRAVVVLFRALFGMYQRHCSRSFSQDINRFIKGLISGFPHFIPHALDFLECLRETTSDSSMYLEILNLLHSQVTSTTSEDLAKDYQYFLQVMRKVSLQKEISPHATIKFLNHLVQNAASIDGSSWILGNGILAVCHNLLVCHGTKQLYTDIGDILFNMMMSYEDMDIQDRALFYYSLLTSATSNKIQEFLKKTSGTQNFNQTISTLLPEEKSDDKSCSKIIEVYPPLLEWHRNTVTTCFEKEEKEFQDIESYYQWLSSADISIKVSYKIQMSKCEKEKVQAISVNIESDNNFEAVKSIQLAEIKSKDSLDVSLLMKPRFPIPTVFRAWVEFTDNMLTYRNDLEEINISLLDMMVPLPKGDQLSLFDKLWIYFTNPESITSRQCVQSIKIVHKTWQKFLERMNQFCSSYKLTEDENNKACYGMLLASGHHLLLLCHEKEEQTNVSIATDSYHMLPFVDKFLTDL
ncbi:AP-5 complex subunit beta-1-like [Mytilus californianus]|uniref:AP-5 complex subunit beta-1-like n=1 Tax=Mytilus californianus TaxID=6549 RepID=UPI0022481806|nr:AP-5 complex subunit beta-1-like [Mytilus californianus]